MTRHAKNCTAGAVYTYHERRKDAQASGYGTENQRIGKESVRDFDCCCLSLQPCRNPVITPDGYLYDKESILEYVIAKKKEIAKQQKTYDKQLKTEQAKTYEKETSDQNNVLMKLKKMQYDLKSDATNSVSESSSVSNMANGKNKHLPSFWLPCTMPNAQIQKLKKPDKTVRCPMSGKPLKMNELMDIKFKEVSDPDDSKAIITKKNRYMCWVTHDILSNSIPVAVIKTTGDVVTVECVEKIIKKDMIHPLTGSKLKESDIIYLQRGGTGYSTTNANLEVKNERPVLQ